MLQISVGRIDNRIHRQRGDVALHDFQRRLANGFIHYRNHFTTKRTMDLSAFTYVLLCPVGATDYTPVRHAMKILVVEDDPLLRDGLVGPCSKAPAHTVDHGVRRRHGNQTRHGSRARTVLLDIMLPETRRR